MADDRRDDDRGEGAVERRPSEVATGSTAAGGQVARRWEAPAPVVRFVTAAWPALWICMFIFGPWQVALVLMFLTGPVMAALHGGRVHNRRQRRELEREQARQQRRELKERVRREVTERVRHDLGQYHGGKDRGGQHHGAPVNLQKPPAPAEPSGGGSTAAASAPHAAPSTSAAERALATTVVRAETSGGRLDADSLALVREVDQLLRPLLARVRARGADADVRRDLELLATEHLPAALEAYLVLPADYAREHQTVRGTTPADELRSQLTLLVEGCRQLRDAVHDADTDRQQELSRFLEAKFRRSDLDL